VLRDRLLRQRWLVALVVAWGVALAALPRLADAAPLPPGREGDIGDLEARRAVLEGRIVRAALLGVGLSPAEAAATLERLTEAERAELAARAHELGAGGCGVELLAFSIIVAMLAILILELAGRRILSRP
jgi:hypothetical protein